MSGDQEWREWRACLVVALFNVDKLVRWLVNNYHPMEAERAGAKLGFLLRVFRVQMCLTGGDSMLEGTKNLVM